MTEFCAIHNTVDCAKPNLSSVNNNKKDVMIATKSFLKEVGKYFPQKLSYLFASKS